MSIRPIQSERDHQTALKQVSTLMEQDPDPGTPQGDRLDMLATQIQAWEARHHPIEPPDPTEAIKFRTEQQERAVEDLKSNIRRPNRSMKP